MKLPVSAPFILLISLAVLVAEKFWLGSVVYDQVLADRQSLLAELIFSWGKPVSRVLTLVAIFSLLFIAPRFTHYRLLWQQSTSVRSFIWLAAQVMLAAGLSLSAPVVLSSQAVPLYGWLWLLGLAVALLIVFPVIAAPGFWKQLAVGEWRRIMVAAVLAVIVWWASQLTQSGWNTLGDMTFFVVAWGLTLFPGELYVDPDLRVIGLDDFVVNIAPECSGYEGIGLILVFTAVYLYTFRRDFRFPRALTLFPLGAVVIWCFNALRILILIVIGRFWSADVAVWGFHAQAGWIAFILASLVVMWIAHRSRWFSLTVSASVVPVSPAIATLMPLIALLASTFLTQALSSGVDWFYPLRVVVTGGVLIWSLAYLQWKPLSLSFYGLAAGLAMALIWWWMVPADTAMDQIYQSAFAGVSGGWLGLWLFFRFAGSVITVPLAEELGFRAYLLCRLGGEEVSLQGSLPLSVLAWLVSSLLFGLLHGAWLAGTVAGLVYAGLRYRSRHIGDAVLAHAVTNAALYAWAVSSGQWSVL